MALATNPLGTVTPPTPETPKIFHERYRHSIVDSSYQPEASLLSMVSGTPRLAQYYHQFLGADEEPAPFGPYNAPTYQSYIRIERMIIKQEGNGAYNFDPQTGESDQKFNGWVQYDRPPLRGNVFISDIGGGNAGLFEITEQPEIRNITDNKVYYITYQLKGILTEELFDQLNSRVVKELVYDKDSVLHGGLSTVSTGAFQTAQDLFQWRNTIASYILRTHYWHSELTIAWSSTSTDKRMVYDQYLVNFLCAVIEPDLRQTYPPITQHSTHYGGRQFGASGDINIWEVLLRGDFNLLSQCQKQAALIPVARLAATRLYGNLRSSKFDLFVATDPERYLAYREFYNMDGYPILEASPSVPLPYLFSEGFYAGNPEGEFEEIIVDVLKNRLVDDERLLKYCKTFWTLGERDRLYNGAILLMLLQISRAKGAPL